MTINNVTLWASYNFSSIVDARSDYPTWVKCRIPWSCMQNSPICIKIKICHKEMVHCKGMCHKQFHLVLCKHTVWLCSWCIFLFLSFLYGSIHLLCQLWSSFDSLACVRNIDIWAIYYFCASFWLKRIWVQCHYVTCYDHLTVCYLSLFLQHYSKGMHLHFFLI